MARRKREKVELNGDEEQLVSFILGKETFGVKVSQIREIGKVKDITKVPMMADYIVGVMNLRGQITTVIDLKKRFGIDMESGITDKSRIIIAEVGETQIGMVVDAVEDVLRVPRSSISPPPKTLASSLDRSYLVGICKLKDKLIMLLDIDSMVNLGQISGVVPEVNVTASS
ncbi:MAG: chemotaxis protein CheW [Methanomassiliicoccus sp.]|nr:chemotaxis protein CheW [Methanomassiliicoccus sp.]